MKKTLHIANIENMIYSFRFHLLLALQQEGYEVHVAAKETKPEVVKKLRAAGIVFHDIPISRGLNPISALKSILKLRTLIKRENFDIVHTNTPTGGMVGRIGAYLAGQKNIYHTTAGFYFHENMDKYRYWFYSSIERYLTSKTKILFSPNKEDIRTSEKLKISPKQETVYCGPSGVDLARYDLSQQASLKKELHKEYGLDDDVIIVGAIGRLVWEKGYREFIDVIKSLNEQGKKVYAVCVGGGPMLEQIQGYATEQSVLNISFVGYSYEVPRYLMSFDILLFPSYREGFPISTLESMAAQTPVVAFNIRGARESIVDGETGYIVDFKDTKAMTQQMVRLIEDSALRQNMAENGRARVEQNFTKQHHIDKQLPYY